MTPTWKTFVRESISEPEKITNQHHDQLNFCGDEAKLAYEEIINEHKKSKVVNTPKRISRRLVLPSEKNDSKKNTVDTCQSATSIDISANIILKAVEQGDLKYLQQHLTHKNVNIVDDFGWTPLMSAAYCGNTLICEFLLKLGAKKCYKDKSGFTALQLAHKKNHLHVVNMLNNGKKIDEIKKVSEKHSIELKKFYCSICKGTFSDTSIKKHETSTLHLFNTNPKLPDTVYGIPKLNKGYQMMLNNGWQENKGLGPFGSGRKYPVKTILKRDRKGLGQSPRLVARVSHFKSRDERAIKHISQPNVGTLQLSQRKKDRDKLLSHERRKERALRRALS